MFGYFLTLVWHDWVSPLESLVPAVNPSWILLWLSLKGQELIINCKFLKLKSSRANSRRLVVKWCNQTNVIEDAEEKHSSPPPRVNESLKSNMYEYCSFIFYFIQYISRRDCVWMRLQLILFLFNPLWSYSDGLSAVSSTSEADRNQQGEQNIRYKCL